MRPNPIGKLDATIRIRRLGSRGRVGRFARDSAWDKIEKFVRRARTGLFFLLFLPIVSSIPLLFSLHGPQRWFALGVAAISGPWFVVVITILWSGVASTLMGLDGESATAATLKKFKSDGWVLVNGLKIRGNADIDHVLVGPGGLLVVESKWSQSRWPSKGHYKKHMSRTLEEAVNQVRRNLDDVKSQFADVLKDVTIQPICVLWSSEDSSADDSWYNFGEVVIVRGPELSLWLNRLTEIELDRRMIERIWREFADFVEKRDEDDLIDSDPPRPTLGTFFLRSVLTPIFATFAGSVSALYGLLAIGHIRPTWLLGSALFFLAIGISARRITFLRQVVLGWIGTSAAFCLMFLGIAIRNHFQ